MIVPFDAEGWRNPSRASAPFLFQTRQVWPEAGSFAGLNGAERARNWAETRDYRVLRNLQAYPRAWVVHDARATTPVRETSRGRRDVTMREILYAPDAVWYDASQPAYDPRSLAWVKRDDMATIGPYLSGQTTGVSETVNVIYPRPEEAVLEVSLDSPGLVVLADVDYPGWGLAIDGKPAPIYRVNAVMRGAAVSSGRHRLVYTYAPQSFRIGGIVSIAGLAALTLLILASVRWPAVAVISGAS